MNEIAASNFNMYLSLGLSAAILILWFAYFLIWKSGGFWFSLLPLPIFINVLLFCIYQSSTGTIKTIAGWSLIFFIIVAVICGAIAYYVTALGRAYGRGH